MTAFVRFDDSGSVYVKTAVDGSWRLVRETATMLYARTNCDVAVPSVVAAAPRDDPPYLVTEPLPGEPLGASWTGDTADRQALAQTAGQILASVHTASFEAAGTIVGGDADALDITHDTWSEVLCALVDERTRDWFPDRFRGLSDDLITVVREVDPRLERGRATLLHGDFSRSNCRLEPAGLLDWERALVGDPAFDITDALSHLVEQPDVPERNHRDLREAFYDGYRDAAGGLPAGIERSRPLYRAISYLLVPQAFDQWAGNVDRPNDELAGDVREEFDARLDRVRETLG